MSVPVTRQSVKDVYKDDGNDESARLQREAQMHETVDSWVHAMAATMHRISSLRLRGLLRDASASVPSLSPRLLPPALPEPPLQPSPPRERSSWDLLLTDITDRYRALHQHVRKRHVLARKQARLAVRAFDEQMQRRGVFRSTEDQERVEMGERKRRAKWVSREVMKRWAYVEMVVEEQKRAEEEEERAREDKKVLLEMLSQSTQLLEEQRAGDPSESNDEDEDEDEGESELTVGAMDTVESVETAELVRPVADTNDEDDDTDDEDATVESEQSEVFSSESESDDEMDGLTRDQDEDMGALMARYQRMQEEENGDTLEPEPGLSDLVVANEPQATTPPAAYAVEQPFLLRGGDLRAYQRQGLDWLAGLYQQQTNGILADEMGLGKTIQTLALLAHLACARGVWGPHLIIVPTSVLMNWQQELLRWVPGFKVLAYFGTREERKLKRRGWSRRNAFHVCVTSYQLAIQDSSVFRRKQWCYMILDEAQAIKNFRSQRWQTLLGFKAERRLLLTGTPLQNSLTELWSLLYFLMPRQQEQQGFADIDRFREWFAQPLEKLMHAPDAAAAADAHEAVVRLHTVLRPYVLRRVKNDVERQLPRKVEHVVYCALSKRQRYLYDDFMERSQTRDVLCSGSYVGVMGCLMQLRKVCNHPDLFETRPVVTSWAASGARVAGFGRTEAVILSVHGMAAQSIARLDATRALELLGMRSALRAVTNEKEESLNDLRIIASEEKSWAELQMRPRGLRVQNTAGFCFQSTADSRFQSIAEMRRYEAREQARRHTDVWLRLAELNRARVRSVCAAGAYACTGLVQPVCGSLVLTARERVAQLEPMLTRFVFATPAVVVTNTRADLERVYPHINYEPPLLSALQTQRRVQRTRIVRAIESRQQMAFPEPFLVQYDCGKLQALAQLLHTLVPQGHRVLVFTQMTRVLDILERWLNLHGLRYLRLDGATKVEQRWRLTEMFNHDAKWSVFISSTRAGGLGINLTGADTVVFYDSDWNHAMDAQCQDRCHRIGQLREVHIYRLVSQNTVEEAIWRKQCEKRWLDNVVIQQGRFDASSGPRDDVPVSLGVGDWYDLASAVLRQASAGGSSGGAVDVDVMSADAMRVDRRQVSDRDAGRARAAAEDETDARALQVAISEVARADALDQGTESDAATPIVPEPTEVESPDNGDDDNGDGGDDDGIGHIDDYMLRFITETTS
ncbi:swr1 complex component [Coemansia sp. RSA 2618]|nr:swr1 complex component [Coemansia sp. RSA 2618]